MPLSGDNQTRPRGVAGSGGFRTSVVLPSGDCAHPRPVVVQPLRVGRVGLRRRELLGKVGGDHRVQPAVIERHRLHGRTARALRLALVRVGVGVGVRVRVGVRVWVRVRVRVRVRCFLRALRMSSSLQAGHATQNSSSRMTRPVVGSMAHG